LGKTIQVIAFVSQKRPDIVLMTAFCDHAKDGHVPRPQAPEEACSEDISGDQRSTLADSLDRVPEVPDKKCEAASIQYQRVGIDTQWQREFATVRL
jgi:hypothetical protein